MDIFWNLPNYWITTPMNKPHMTRWIGRKATTKKAKVNLDPSREKVNFRTRQVLRHFGIPILVCIKSVYQLGCGCSPLKSIVCRFFKAYTTKNDYWFWPDNNKRIRSNYFTSKTPNSSDLHYFSNNRKIEEDSSFTGKTSIKKSILS